MRVGIFDLEHVMVIWGHSVHFSENWVISHERLIIERSGQKFGSRGVCNMHVGIFDLEHVKVIWGHSVQFCENWPVTQKQFIVEPKRRKFGPRGVYVTCMLVFLTLNMSRLFGVIRCTFAKLGL